MVVSAQQNKYIGWLASRGQPGSCERSASVANRGLPLRVVVSARTQTEVYQFAKSNQSPNPKSLSRLLLRVKVDSGMRLPMVNVLVDFGVDIRWGFSQLLHMVPYTTFFFEFGLGCNLLCSNYFFVTLESTVCRKAHAQRKYLGWRINGYVATP